MNLLFVIFLAVLQLPRLEQKCNVPDKFLCQALKEVNDQLERSVNLSVKQTYRQRDKNKKLLGKEQTYLVSVNGEKESYKTVTGYSSDVVKWNSNIRSSASFYKIPKLVFSKAVFNKSHEHVYKFFLPNTLELSYYKNENAAPVVVKTNVEGLAEFDENRQLKRLFIKYLINKNETKLHHFVALEESTEYKIFDNLDEAPPLPVKYTSISKTTNDFVITEVDYNDYVLSHDAEPSFKFSYDAENLNFSLFGADSLGKPLNTDQIFEIINTRTYKLSGGGKISTAFLLSADGNYARFLCTWHALEGVNKIKLEGYHGEFTANDNFFNLGEDVALIVVKTSFAVKPITFNKPKLGINYNAYGFPKGIGQYLQATYCCEVKDIYINNVKFSSIDLWNLDSVGGMSGSVMIDDFGNAVGILSFGDVYLNKGQDIDSNCRNNVCQKISIFSPIYNKKDILLGK